MSKPCPTCKDPHCTGNQCIPARSRTPFNCPQCQDGSRLPPFLICTSCGKHGSRRPTPRPGSSMDWELWARELCSTYHIPSNNHPSNLQLAISQWMHNHKSR